MRLAITWPFRSNVNELGDPLLSPRPCFRRIALVAFERSRDLASPRGDCGRIAGLGRALTRRRRHGGNCELGLVERRLGIDFDDGCVEEPASVTLGKRRRPPAGAMPRAMDDSMIGD